MRKLINKDTPWPGNVKKQNKNKMKQQHQVFNTKRVITSCERYYQIVT